MITPPAATPDQVAHGMSARARFRFPLTNCLGWDCSITSQANYRGKDGGIVDGSAGLQIFFGILAGSLPVVVATNSDPGKPISAIVQTALMAATSPP